MLHPVEHARWVDVDAPFGQQLHTIGVGQPEPQIPAHGEGHDVIGEAIAAEG